MQDYNESDIVPIYNEPSDEDIERAEELYMYILEEKEKEKIPEIVFKYKSINSPEDLVRICDILKNNRMYMPKLKELNDPLESCVTKWLGNIDERAKKLESYRVLSLSAEPLLSTMWAYYANNYSGVCFGFKTKNKFSNIEKVNYFDKQEAVEWEFCSNCLYKKGKAWKHEAEFRIIRDSNDNNFFDYDADDLVCVIFGDKITAELRNFVESFIPKHIPIFTVKSDKSNFRLYAERDTKRYCVEELIKELTTTIKML